MIDLDSIISRIKKTAKVSYNKDIAELMGLSAADFSLRKKRGTLLPKIIEWGINQNVNLDWLINGHEYSNESRTLEEKHQEASNVVEFEHMELVKKFKNKERGKLINEQLIELESISDQVFLNVANYIQSTLENVRIVKGESLNQKGRMVGKKERKKA